MQEVANVSHYLKEYLDSTRLSMNQVAKKWGVSSALLSQIKNNKKRPGFELGLKILRETKAPLEIRESWARCLHNNSEEAATIYKDIEKDREELRLQSRISERFENNPILMDIYLDISLMGECGLSSQTILREYGMMGIENSKSLVESGLIKLVDSKYKKTTCNIPTGLTPESSFVFMKHIFGDLKDRYLRNQFKGEFHFDLTDLDEETYLLIKKEQLEFNKKIIRMIKDKEMPRVKGGKRVIIQSLVSALKCFVLIFLFSQTNILLANEGNGVTGGASGLIQKSNLHEFRRSGFDYGMYHGKKFPYSIRRHRVGHDKFLDIQFKRGALSSLEFRTKESAKTYAVQLNQLLSSWKVEKAAVWGLLRQKFPVNCQAELFIKPNDIIDSEIKIVPVGFKIETLYTPGGEERYKSVNHYFFPCVKD